MLRLVAVDEPAVEPDTDFEFLGDSEDLWAAHFEPRAMMGSLSEFRGYPGRPIRFSGRALHNFAG